MISSETVRQLIENQFPQLSPVTVRMEGEGWDNTVYRVNETYIFRFPRRKVAVDLITVENALLPAIYRLLPIPVPNPVYVGVSSERYPFPFSGYRGLDGVPPYVVDLTDEQRAKSAHLLGRFLRALHQIPADQAVTMGATDSDTIGRMDLEKRVPMFHTKLAQAKQFGLIDDEAAMIQAIEGLPTDITARPVLVHGDLNFRNFLVGVDGVVSGIIDWGDVHIGQAAMDLTIAFSFLPHSARDAFRNAYGHISDVDWKLARFRSLYSNLVILLYAFDIGDERQLGEAKKALQLTLDD
jgi:aminoglycoside phosphotransferase (APT) family kinase protein